MRFLFIKELVGRAMRPSEPPLHLPWEGVDYGASCFVLCSSPLQSISNVPTLLWGVSFSISGSAIALITPGGSCWCYQRHFPTALLMGHTLTNAFNIILCCCLGIPWCCVFQALFLILTIPCEVTTSMITHSLPLPKPYLGRWVSCWGHWRIIEPLFKTKWGMRRSNQERQPLRGRDYFPMPGVTQPSLQQELHKRYHGHWPETKSNCYPFRKKKCGYFRG